MYPILETFTLSADVINVMLYCPIIRQHNITAIKPAEDAGESAPVIVIFCSVYRS